MQSTPQAGYPARIQPLLSLGFIALAWVVLNQFRTHLGLHAGDRSGLVFKGYLGAELFFVLSGFLVSHFYVTAEQHGGFNYASLLRRGLARVYPLHLVVIVVMALLVAAARIGGAPAPTGVFDLRGLIANITLIQAWGVTPTVTWNFPSWLISAEWFALIVFPVTAKIALAPRRPAWLIIALALALFVVAFNLAAEKGVLFTDMTAQIGALQTVPAFLMGAGLYQLGRRHSLPLAWAETLAVGAGVWIVFSAAARLSDLAIWPAFAVLVFALAETSKSAKPALSFAPLPYLGSIAYSVYLVYLPVDIVYFHGVQRLFGAPHGAFAWVVWAGVFPVILLTGALAHHALAGPAQAWFAAREQRVSAKARRAAAAEG